MRALKLVSILLLAGFGLAACASGGTTGKITPQGYVTNAASSDRFEIASSQMALEKSRNPDIRAFATQMIADHGMTSDMLLRTINANHIMVVVPQEGYMLPHHRYMLDKLSRAEDFDKAYIAAQAHAHDEAVMLHQSYTDNGSVPALSRFAGGILPQLQLHRDMAIGMANMMCGKDRHMWPFSYRDLMIWRD